VMLAAGEVDVCRHMIATSRSKPQPFGVAFLDQVEGMVELEAGSVERSCELLRDAAEAFAAHEWRLDELRTRVFLGEALMRAGNADEGSTAQLQGALDGARRLSAELVASEALATARRLGVELTEQPSDGVSSRVEQTLRTPVGERLVTVMFADVRGYTAMTAARSPSEMAGRIASLQRWAKQEVARHHGVVDKFAGDAVMATFNVAGDSIDHCQHAVEAALALRDKAALANLQLGVGIAVGPAIVGSLVSGGNLSVLGDATNLAARLQAQAGPGELLLSEAAHKRVDSSLQERATREQLTLKGLDEPAIAYRIKA
jgi:class 3 adenylate cyclase